MRTCEGGWNSVQKSSTRATASSDHVVKWWLRLHKLSFAKVTPGSLDFHISNMANHRHRSPNPFSAPPFKFPSVSFSLSPSLFIATSRRALSFLGTFSYTVDVKSRKCQTNFASQIVVHRARQNYVIIVVLTGPLVIKTWWLTWVELALLAPHNAFISL